jgi:hypothetical protein
MIIFSAYLIGFIVSQNRNFSKISKIIALVPGLCEAGVAEAANGRVLAEVRQRVEHHLENSHRPVVKFGT